MLHAHHPRWRPSIDCCCTAATAAALHRMAWKCSASAGAVASAARLAAAGGQQAAKREPVVLRQLALRDGDKTRQSRFGRQQVVEPRVEAALVDVVPSRSPQDRHRHAPLSARAVIHAASSPVSCATCSR
ncbi:MAG: hypothetical protein WDW36_010032 [Sanguina aurantia]